MNGSSVAAIADSPLIRRELGFVLLFSFAAVEAAVSRCVRIPYTESLADLGIPIELVAPKGGAWEDA